MRKWPLVTIGALILIAAVPYFSSRPPFKSLFLNLVGAKLKGKVEVEKMELSWLGPQRFINVRLTSVDLDGTIETLSSKVPFWSLSSMDKSLNLVGGAFQIHAQGAPTASVERVQAKISGPMIHATGITREGDQTGELTIEGKAANPSVKNPDIDLTLHATRMPTLFVDRLLDAKGFLAAALGATFDCVAKAMIHDNKGVLDLNLRAESTEAIVNAAFDDESFTLRKPLSISFQLNPILSEKILKDVNPLFLTGVQSKTPVLLQISNQNFFFPRPFSLAKLRIDQGLLDMGQVRIQNGPSLASLVKLLKSSSLSNSKQMNAWFTPLAFSLKQGQLQTGRMDFLLANSIHLCTWGNVDLQNDQLYMTLGIPSDTLTSAFGLKNIPINYIMAIPIQGSTGEPELVTGPATAKIAALLASQNIPKKAGPFGGLVSLFAPAVLDDSADAPPPKRPFPWER